MGVVLKGLLASELRILTPHFAKTTDANIFRRRLSFQRLSFSLFSVKTQPCSIFFLSSTELVVQNFSIILYNVLRCFYFTCTSYVNNVGSHIVRALRYLLYFKLA